MKKLFSLIICLGLCFLLFGCGHKVTPPATEPEVPVTSGAEKLKDPVTGESLSGTYTARLWFLDHNLTFHADGSYSFGSEEQGTYTFDDKYLTLSCDTGKRNFLAGNNCVYTFESWHFDADTESGVTFSPDANGLSDQSFTGHMPEGNIPGCDYNYIFLDLNEDGTFSLQLGVKDETDITVKETFEGTYFCKNATLMLTYNGENYPLIMNNANYIFFLIYDKV